MRVTRARVVTYEPWWGPRDDSVSLAFAATLDVARQLTADSAHCCLNSPLHRAIRDYAWRLMDPNRLWVHIRLYPLVSGLFILAFAF